MFGIGFLELCLIAIAALVCVGPKKLPELMKELGKFYVQIRRMSSDVKSSIDQVINEAEIEMRDDEIKKRELALAKRAEEARTVVNLTNESAVMEGQTLAFAAEPAFKEAEGLTASRGGPDGSRLKAEGAKLAEPNFVAARGGFDSAELLTTELSVGAVPVAESVGTKKEAGKQTSLPT